MHSLRRGSQIEPHLIGYLALCTALILTGCASPGPPRAPSLQLPQPVRDLTAQRIGNTVELHFTAPSNSTDKLALRGSTLSGQLCRQLPHQPCTPASARLSIPVSKSNDTKNLVTWADTLPTNLTAGPPQRLAYRVEFFNASNRSAGPSNQAFTATGPPPAPVQNLHAQGTRQGILLRYAPAEGDIVLIRRNLASDTPATSGQKRKPTPTTVWLQTNDSNSQAGLTLDTTAQPDTPYTYAAQRRIHLQLGSLPVELRSALSEPITYTLSTVYPPPAPTGLTAAGYSQGSFAVDLIWQPITETNLTTPLAGYNLYREPIAPTPAKQQQLNTLPLQQPAFHDTTASPTTTYRYSVTAVDTKGNESPATTITLSPTP